jgi:hypothetical protein
MDHSPHPRSRSSRAKRSAITARRAAITAMATTALALGLASNAAAQTYESNDGYLSAYGPIMADTAYSAALETENDQDYYFFYVPQRTQMFFSLTMTNTPPNGDYSICSEVTQQTHAGYSSIDDTELTVGEGQTRTAAITLGRGKYFFSVYCSDAVETYSFRITPPGTTSTYEPFAAQCAAAHGPVVAANAKLVAANQKLNRNRRKLARARARGARRATLRRLKNRVRTARREISAARSDFRSAVAAEQGACAVPM